jgi:hypothetical protein
MNKGNDDMLNRFPEELSGTPPAPLFSVVLPGGKTIVCFHFQYFEIGMFLRFFPDRIHAKTD